LKLRIIVITLVLIGILSSIILLEHQNKIRFDDLRTAELLSLKFLEREMMNEQGGVFFKFPNEFQIFSESTALLMWYSVLKGNRNLFEKELRVIRDYHLDKNVSLLHWKLRASMDPWLPVDSNELSNALIDDLTTIKALLLAHQKWNDDRYLSLVEILASGILRCNVVNNVLRQSATWSSDYQEFRADDTVILSYADLSTAKQVAENSTKWLEAINSTLDLLLKGQAENGLFWYAYNVDEGRYVGENNTINSIIQMALTANQLAQVGFEEQATKFLDFFEGERRIYGHYDVVTGKAVVDFENIAGYSWLALLATNLEREDFALKIIREKLIATQFLDKSSRLYGAFTLSQDEAYVYDQLVTLIVLRTYLNKYLGTILDNSWFSIYFLILSTWYVAVVSVTSKDSKGSIKDGESTEHYFTILIPAKNEEFVIKNALDSVFSLDYPSEKFDVLVINDGSTDNTGAILKAYMSREPRLRVLNIPINVGGKGKGAALNRGMRYILEKGAIRPPESWVIGIFDADSIVENQMLKKVSFQFLSQKVAGVQTLVRIRNRNKNLLAKMQDVEFLVYGTVIQRSRSNYRGAVLLGGNGQFTRFSALESARTFSRNGKFWNPTSLTEDSDLALRLLMKGYDNVFIDTTCVWQEGPERLSVFFRQRMRWARGMLDVLFNLFHPDLWQSKLSWLKRLDLIHSLFIFLTMPFILLAIWIFNVNAFIGNLFIWNRFPDSILWVNTFAFFPMISLGLYRKTGYSLAKIPLYCFITIIYALHWALCLSIVFGLMTIRKKQSWVKTPRVGAQ